MSEDNIKLFISDIFDVLEENKCFMPPRHTNEGEGISKAAFKKEFKFAVAKKSITIYAGKESPDLLWGKVI